MVFIESEKLAIVWTISQSFHQVLLPLKGGCDFSSGYPLGAFFAQMAIFFGPLIFFEKKIWTPKFFLLIFHTPEIVGPSLTDFQTPYIIDR